MLGSVLGYTVASTVANPKSKVSDSMLDSSPENMLFNLFDRLILLIH